MGSIRLDIVDIKCIQRLHDDYIMQLQGQCSLERQGLETTKNLEAGSRWLYVHTLFHRIFDNCSRLWYVRVLIGKTTCQTCLL